jgi:hypothetical protein
MIAFDSDDFESASAHAQVAARLFDVLQDPWGELESKLLLAQVALARGDAEAAALVAAGDSIQLDEAEPRQHRHLTRAWLAQKQERWSDAEAEIEQARTVFGGGWSQTGDHTPALLKRLVRLAWNEPAHTKIDRWLQGVERSEVEIAVASDSSPSAEAVELVRPIGPKGEIAGGGRGV